jgi:hypothetical protein
MRVEPTASLGADAAPLADQERAAEQIGRSCLKVPSGAAGWNSQRRADLHPVAAPFVQGWADPHERGGLCEQWQLDRCGRAEVDKVPPAKPVEDRPEGGAVLQVLSQISRADMRHPRTRIGLSRQRIELPSGTHFACRPQLAFADHVHEFDASKGHRG